MATLLIREYQQLGVGQIPDEPGVDQTPVTFSTSAQSAAFGAETNYIGITADAAFHYVVGANPTATTSAFKLPADTPIFIGVKPGQKIAAIAAA